MNGPKPVCAAAWKKFSPLSPSRAVGMAIPGVSPSGGFSAGRPTGLAINAGDVSHQPQLSLARPRQPATASARDRAQPWRDRLAKLVVQVEVVLRHAPRGEAP